MNEIKRALRLQAIRKRSEARKSRARQAKREARRLRDQLRAIDKGEGMHDVVAQMLKGRPA